MFGSTSTSVQSSSSALGFQPYFWRTQNSSKHLSTPQPFGSPFGTQTGSMNTSSGVFGTHHCSSCTIPSSTTFGPSSSPAFGASSPASPVLGFWLFIPVGPTCIPAFGGMGPFGSTTQPLQPAVASSLYGSSMPFGGSSHPAFGATTAPTFGASNTPTFGATTAPTFGATTAPTFGVTIAPTFGATIAPTFGATIAPTFGATIAPSFGAITAPSFGATTAPSFGATTAPSFGATTAPSFGATTSPSFGATTAPSFGATTAPSFGATTAPSFGATTAPSFGATTAPSFGATTAPSFGATTTPSFGATTTPSFGGTSPFGSITQPSCLFGLSMPFNASTPAFGAASTSAFGATGTLAFGATSTPAFGATSTPAFDSKTGPTFGSTSASCGVSSSPLFGFGGAFGTSKNPAFGSSGFGPSNIPSFCFSSQPTFGQSSCTSHFGSQSSPFGVQATSFLNPTFQQSNYWGQQRGGTRVTSYAATPEPDDVNATGKLESISAMPAYKEKGYEELRWEDYQVGDKGGPALGGSEFGMSASEPNPLNHAPSFPQSSTSPFNSTSQSHMFPPKTLSFTSSGFGVSSTPLSSSIIGHSTSTNLFATSSSPSLITSSAPSAISFSSPTQIGNSTFNNGLFNFSAPLTKKKISAPVAQTCAFGQSTTSFPQNTTPFGQSSLFHAPSTDFGLGSSSTFSSASKPMSFNQTPPLLNGGLGFKNLTQIQPGTQSATSDSRLVSYVATSDPYGVNATDKLESISAMPAYKEKSHEELRWEDYYKVREKAGPAPAGGSGFTLQQSNPLNPALSFPLTSTFSLVGCLQLPLFIQMYPIASGFH